MVLSQRKSNILSAIKSVYGDHLGEQLCRSVSKFLTGKGIDAHLVTPMESKKGNNALLFSYQGEFVVKINNGLENHQTETPNSIYSLRPLRKRTIGYDMGQVPIHIELHVQMNTKDINDLHRESLKEALASEGFVFSDDKLDNIGLMPESGLPYVIDSGAIHYSGKISQNRTNVVHSWPIDQKDNSEVIQLENRLLELEKEKEHLTIA